MGDVELFGSLHEKGDVIFREGDIGNSMYIIQSGAVEINCRRGGNKIVLNLLEQGDFFGEMAILDNRPRSASAVAISRARLLQINKDFFSGQAPADPSVIFHLIKSLCHRIENTNRILRSCFAADQDTTGSDAISSEGRVESEVNPSFEKPNKSSDPAQRSLEESVAWPEIPDKLFQETDLPSIHFRQGETIFKEGEDGSEMFVVIEGEVEIFTEAADKKLRLMRLGPMSFFGEMALVTGHPRAASAMASKDTRLMAISNAQLIGRIEQEPALALFIIQVLVARLRSCTIALESPGYRGEMVRKLIPPVLKKQKKVKLAIISLSSCGGCAATWIQNRVTLAELAGLADVVYCPMLMDAESFDPVDIALVDGAVRMAEDEDILKKARFNSETLVAWGTCAVFGGLPAMANQYELEDLIEESFGAAADPFAYYMSGLDRTQALQAHDPDLLLRKARKLDDIVKVDYFLPGCPPDVSRFMDLVKELKGEEMDRRAKAVVCAECPRKPFKNNVQSMWAFPSAEAAHDICFISQGALCMGLMTRGGCDASCVKGGLPCWGCRGPTAKVIKELNEGGYCEELLSALVARRTKLQPETLRMAVRILRQKGGTSFCFEQNFIKDPSRLR